MAVLFILLGLVAGALSGVVGIGGGAFIVPALTFFFGLSQHQAQGTSLAMLLPPIGILAAWTYYKQGHVDLRIAALLCLGFILGSLFGARLAVGLSNAALKKVFGAALLLISLRMLLSK